MCNTGLCPVCWPVSRGCAPTNDDCWPCAGLLTLVLMCCYTDDNCTCTAVTTPCSQLVCTSYSMVNMAAVCGSVGDCSDRLQCWSMLMAGVMLSMDTVYSHSSSVQCSSRQVTVVMARSTYRSQHKGHSPLCSIFSIGHSPVLRFLIFGFFKFFCDFKISGKNLKN